MLREKLHFEEVLFRADGLIAYSQIKKDGIISLLREICASICYDPELKGINEKYFNFAGKLLEAAEEHGFSGNVLRKYIIWLFMNDVNVFSLACEKGLNVNSSTLYKIAYKDLGFLKYLMDFDLKNICENLGYGEKLYDYTPTVVINDAFVEQISSLNEVNKIIDQFCWYYSRMGCGEFARYKMFKYDEKSGLIGISNSDGVVFSDIIGYEEQKRMILANTEAFLNGSYANNMLLVGARGTGKSSCVKALANRFFDMGLRLVEVHKDQAHCLPELLGMLVKRGKRIIIYIDDLSYDDFEIQFKYLKSVIEGSAEAKPRNVLFYVTSNRRHIIQEKWEDRAGEAGEVHESDALNEKLSLSDRFGMTVVFPKPGRAEYLNIVVGLAKKEKLTIPEDFLKEQALKWELQKGLSGRTARQFINHIKWELSKE